METIIWSKNYETGNPIVDGQHKNLFTMINNLNLSLLEGHSNVVLLETMERLSAYVEIHFKTEEDLMFSNSYPDFAIHKKEHDNLREQAKKLIHLFQLNKVDLTATVSQFLSDWLKHHINEVDIKMIEWIKEKI